TMARDGNPSEPYAPPAMDFSLCGGLRSDLIPFSDGADLLRRDSAVGDRNRSSTERSKAMNKPDSSHIVSATKCVSFLSHRAAVILAITVVFSSVRAANHPLDPL